MLKAPQTTISVSLASSIRDTVCGRFRGDKEIVLNAVSQSWWALQWVPAAIRGDRDVMLNAVAQNWQASRKEWYTITLSLWEQLLGLESVVVPRGRSWVSAFIWGKLGVKVSIGANLARKRANPSLPSPLTFCSNRSQALTGLGKDSSPPPQGSSMGFSRTLRGP